MNGVGVHERNLKPEQPLTRLAVDQLGAFPRELGHGGRQITDLVRDVVHPGAAPREESPDGGLLAERREELDAISPDTEGSRLDPELHHRLAVLEPGGEEPSVRRERLVEIADRDPNVVDAERLHEGDAR